RTRSPEPFGEGFASALLDDRPRRARLLHPPREAGVAGRQARPALGRRAACAVGREKNAGIGRRGERERFGHRADLTMLHPSPMTTMRAKRTISVASKPVRRPPSQGEARGGGGKASERAHVLDVPFAMRGVATAGGARWDAERNVFLYRGESL